MSDIHGNLDRFEKVLKQIDLQDDDKVYILGDVIDRNPYGIEILLRIMEDEKFEMLLGNHEYMMLDYLDKYYQKKKTSDALNLWALNGGMVTRSAFFRLSKDEQLRIYHYLRNLGVAICDLMVNDHMFYLVHANANMNYTKGKVYCDDIDDLYSMIWNRRYDDSIMFDDRTIVAGHTIVAYYTMNYQDPMSIYFDSDNIKDASYIDLDCGSGANSIISRLSCLRLDDFECFYG